MSRSLQFVAMVAAFLVLLPACQAQVPENGSSAVVDVYLNALRTIVLPGVTDATVLDPDVARVECVGDDLQFTGLQRGETLAVAHVNGKALSLIVRVVLRPVLAAPPSLGASQIERGIGTLGSDVQISRIGGNTNAVLLDSVFWRQQIGDDQFGMSMSADHSTLPGQYAFNLRSGNINYRTPRVAIDLLDQNVDLSGADVTDHIQTFSIADTLQIRGAGLSIVRGKNQWSFFGGVTVPYYFLSLASSRDIAGAAFRRKLTEKFSVFTATSFLRIPVPGSSTRRTSLMQQGGFRFLASRRLSFDGVGGISNSGGLLRGNMNYTGARLSAFVSALHSSPLYPLNQIQSLFAGTSSVRTGITSQLSRRLGASFYFEHTSLRSGLLHLTPATSDYFSPSFTLNLTRHQSATVSYTRSFSAGGFQDTRQSGSRFDASLRSVFHERFMNSAQVMLGSIQDPLQISSQSQLTLNDTISFRVRAASLQLSLSHNRTNPSLVQKLNQELNLLSPQLQQLFSQDPTNFAVSNLPPELRALLDSQEPISTAVGVTAQIPVTGKFSFNPNVSVNRDTLGTQQRNWTSFFGYSLTYQLSRSLQLRSSLSSIWMAQTSRASMQRTTVFSAGMVKTFSGSPAHLLARRSRRTIQGRIYRDDNINGVFNRGEQGIAGVQVQLDGSETAVTDEQGLYRFSDVGGGVHRVSLALAQFPNPVRMTTTGEFEIDMDAPGMHSADFGIINFARLMGTVFNDLRFQGVVQPDSIGVGNVHLFLRKGGQTVMTVVIPPSGHFEEDNIAPGDYDLVVDENSIPANYSTNISAIPVHIAPVSTVVANLPLRAMRSISGHVFLSATNEASAKRDDAANKDKLVPLAGVHLAAGGSEATTGSDGAFVLRNLPAGELTVTLVPAAKLPDNLKLPAGRVQMPAEPVQIQNATIVLSNRELVPYLVRK